MRQITTLDAANDFSNWYRAFLTRTYPTMKKHNPTTPIMLREAQGTLPKVYARYDFGKEKSQSLEGREIHSYISVSGREVELGDLKDTEGRGWNSGLERWANLR